MAFAAALVAVLSSALAACGGGATATTGVPAPTSAPGAITASSTSASSVTTAAPIASTTATSPGQPKGEALFEANCAVCHGTEGQGLRGPDLRSLGESDQARTVSRIANGGTNMPAFGAKLSGEEITSVADYVISLQ